MGTIYDSWPKPGTRECVEFSGCDWAGQFASLDAGPAKGPAGCRPPAVWMDGGDGSMACRCVCKLRAAAAVWLRARMRHLCCQLRVSKGRLCVCSKRSLHTHLHRAATHDCRYNESLVASWSVAATYGKKFKLFGRKLAVAIENDPQNRSVVVNVIDKCANRDCGGCCRRNTGGGRWPLIDLEKWPAAVLLGFNHSAANFDINDVDTPDSAGLRKKAPEDDVMPLCYLDLGPSDVVV